MFNCELPLDWNSSKRPIAAVLGSLVESKSCSKQPNASRGKSSRKRIELEEDDAENEVENEDCDDTLECVEANHHCKSKKNKEDSAVSHDGGGGVPCHVPAVTSRRSSHLTAAAHVGFATEQQRVSVHKNTKPKNANVDGVVVALNKKDKSPESTLGLTDDGFVCTTAITSTEHHHQTKQQIFSSISMHPLGNKTQLLSVKEMGHQRRVFLEDEDDDDATACDLVDFTDKFSVDPVSCRIQPPNMGDIKKLIIHNLHTALRVLTEQHPPRQREYLRKMDSQCVDAEISNLNRDGSAAAKSVFLLDTDNLISRLPYKKMLADMFGNNLRGHLNNSNIPYVTRVYEESFMREPMNSGERPCAKGKFCECMFLDKAQPFVGVEFLLPGEQPPRTPNMCVLCYRSTTQQLYYDVIFDKCDFPGCIQKFGNIHSEPGEYSLDAMLIAAPTAPIHIMPLPIVSHQRNRYVIYVASGIKRLKQSKVYFRITPSCNQEIGLSCQ